MFKILFRSLALLLVVCLIADPTLASALYRQQWNTGHAAGLVLAQTSFLKDCLSPRGTTEPSGNPEAINYQPTIEVNRIVAGISRSEQHGAVGLFDGLQPYDVVVRELSSRRHNFIDLRKKPAESPEEQTWTDRFSAMSDAELEALMPELQLPEKGHWPSLKDALRTEYWLVNAPVNNQQAISNIEGLLGLRSKLQQPEIEGLEKSLSGLLKARAYLRALFSRWTIFSSNAGNPSTFHQFLTDPENSRQIEAELRENRTDTLATWLMGEVNAGRLSIEINDYGTALAWLIHRFPLHQKGTGEELGGELHYGTMLEIIQRFDFIAKLPESVTIEQKVFLLKSFSTFESSQGSYSEKIYAVANTFIELVGPQDARKVVRIILSAPDQSIGQTLEAMGDVRIIGESAVAEAKHQGWYRDDRSFARHHIVYAKAIEGGRRDNVVGRMDRILEELPKHDSLFAGQSPPLSKNEEFFLSGLNDKKVRGFVTDLMVFCFSQFSAPGHDQITRSEIERMVDILSRHRDFKSAKQALHEAGFQWGQPGNKFHDIYARYRKEIGPATKYAHLKSHLWPNPLIENAVIIDMGAGNMAVDVQLIKDMRAAGIEEKFIPTIHGFDFGPDPRWPDPKIKYTQVTERSNIPEMVGDLKADFLLLEAVLHHMPDDIMMAKLREASQLVKPNGKVIVVEDVALQSKRPESDENGLASRAAALSDTQRIQAFSVFDWHANLVVANNDYVPMPGNYLTENEWEKRFLEAGFKIVDSQYLGVYSNKFSNLPHTIFVLQNSKHRPPPAYAIGGGSDAGKNVPSVKDVEEQIMQRTHSAYGRAHLLHETPIRINFKGHTGRLLWFYNRSDDWNVSFVTYNPVAHPTARWETWSWSFNDIYVFRSGLDLFSYLSRQLAVDGIHLVENAMEVYRILMPPTKSTGVHRNPESLWLRTMAARAA